MLAGKGRPKTEVDDADLGSLAKLVEESSLAAKTETVGVVRWLRCVRRPALVVLERGDGHLVLVGKERGRVRRVSRGPDCCNSCSRPSMGRPNVGFKCDEGKIVLKLVVL